MTCSPDYSEARRLMVERQLRARGIVDPGVLEAMGCVPRERFVPPANAACAYDDRALPIGHGQTISQPYVAALMMELLACRADSRVLDVGAGSGYQSAVLARLAGGVCAVERIGELADRAERTLADLGVDNVTFAVADGSLGWADEAPFDRIICGAAAPDVPHAWLEQLADGGRIVAPLGERGNQHVVLVRKSGGAFERQRICAVRFVPLIGQDGFGA